MTPIRPYGVAMTEAITTKNLEKMKQAAKAAHDLLASDGDIVRLKKLLDLEIAKASASHKP